MKANRSLFPLGGIAAAILAIAPHSHGALLNIANASFESPVFADGNFANNPTVASQGAYGWTFGSTGNIGGILNPSVGYYATATGSGTPTGADGAQVAYVFRQGGSAIQTLAGSDNVLGNADDPLLLAQTTYTLTIAVGQRLPGNPSGTNAYGTLVFTLLAGNTVIAENTSVPGPSAPGLFEDRSISVDSASLSSALYGQALTIRITQTQAGDFSADLDNVRLNALTIPEPSSVFLFGIGGAAGVFCGLRRRDWQ